MLAAGADVDLLVAAAAAAVVRVAGALVAARVGLPWLAEERKKLQCLQ